MRRHVLTLLIVLSLPLFGVAGLRPAPAHSAKPQVAPTFANTISIGTIIERPAVPPPMPPPMAGIWLNF